MNRLLAVLTAFAGLAFAFPVPALAQDSPDEIEESGPRLGEAEARRILAQPLAAGATREQQVDYHERRQRAAFTVGNSAARVQALRHLVELTAAPDKLSPWAGYLWREIWRYGNQTEALEMGESLAGSRLATPLQRASYTVDLGMDYAGLGNRDRAADLLERVEAMRKEIGQSGPGMTAYIEVSTERLRSIVLHNAGNPEGALAAIRRALEASRAEVERARATAGASRTGLEYDRAIRLRNGTMSYAVWLYFYQGRNEEAEGLARLGLRLAAEERTGGAVVGYWHGKLAQALLGERRFEESVAAANEAVAALRAAGVVASALQMINTQTYLMQACFGLERWAEADQVASAMRTATVDDEAARGIADNPILQSFLHLKNGRVEQARQRIDVSVSYRQRFNGAKHATTIEALAVRALVLQALGESGNALDDYKAVLDFVFAPESTFADAQPGGVRGFYLPQALRGFLALVRERQAAGRADEELADLAFRVADRLQLSVVQQAMIDSAARVLAATPELGALARREQEQRIKAREMLAQFNKGVAEEGRLAREAKERLEAGKAAKQDPQKLAEAAKAERERARANQAALRKLRGVNDALARERGELQLEIGRRFPAYQALVNPKPPSLAGLAKLLAKGEAFVSVYPTAQGTFVWGIAEGEKPVFHVAALTSAQARELVTRLRATLDVGEAPNPAGVAFDAATSHRLYQELLAPVWKALASPRVVTIATASELAQLPFAVLTTRAPESPFRAARAAWLVRDAAVNQVSSAAAFQALRSSRRREQPDSAFFGFGDPLFRSTAGPTRAAGAVRTLHKPGRGVGDGAQAFDYGAIPPLPETREEIVAIARALGADPVKDARFGAEATRAAALSTDLSGRRVVAFATHGLKPGDIPGLSRPALAMAAGARGESPLLQLDDVLTMKLNADWIVLSACNTASADGRAQEAYSGLARAFFFAGARSVMATHWAVETVSAQQLVTRTFAHQAANGGVSRAESLRQAQIELIDGKAGAAFAHPFFWAPYALYGDPSS